MKLHHLASLALLALSLTAFADGFYGLGEVTHSSASLDHTHFDSSLTANGATGLSSSDSGSGNQWRLQGGYRFNPYLAVEAGYKLTDHVDARADYDYVSGLGDSGKTGKMDVTLFSLGLAYNF